MTRGKHDEKSAARIAESKPGISLSVATSVKIKRMLNICSRVRLERQPRRLSATEPTLAEKERLIERIRERDTIRVEVRDRFAETLIIAGTFIRKGNPVTCAL